MLRKSAILWLTAGVVLSAAGVARCSRPADIPRGNDQVKPTYNEKTGRLERIAYDRNRDGKEDAWTFMDGTRIVRAELDDDYDGTVDHWEYYDQEGGSAAGSAEGRAAGVLQRVEIAARHDGKVSRTEFYEQGQCVKAEEDTDADGRVDKWETWANGAQSLVLLDTDTDGVPDRRIVYPADGSAPRFEVADADGSFRPAP